MAGPNAADWIGAFGTGGALLLGVYVLFREQRDRRRAQARQVNAWAVDVLPKRHETETGAIVGMKGKCVEVTAQNTSLEPVYDLHVWVHHNYDPHATRTGSLERSILPPGSHEIYVDGIEIPEGGLAGLPYVDVTFRDTAGRRWQRLHNGELSRDRSSPEGKERLLRYRLRRGWRLAKLRLNR